MQSIAVYGRLVVRAVLSELTTDLPRAIPWHGSLSSTQPLRRSFHLVTAASGLSKTHSTLASSQNLLKPRTFGDDACFVARHTLGDVIGMFLGSGLKPGPARPSKTRPAQPNYRPGTAGKFSRCGLKYGPAQPVAT